jgi:hypothetical protein
MTVINTADKIYVGSSLASKVYSGSNLVWPPAAAYDSATAAWIAAVGTGNVNTAHKGYVDTLIVGLKTDGVWTKLDRLWLLAAQNTTCALVDIVALATGTAVNSPTFTADRGYTGNGANMYIDTNFNPTSGTPKYSQNSACFFAWNNTAGADVGCILGSVTSSITNGTLLIKHTDTNQYSSICANPIDALYGAYTFAFNSASGTGLWLLNRSSSSAATADFNGADQSAPINGTSAAFASDKFAVLLGYAGAGYSSQQCSCAGWGSSLTSGERAAVYSRLRTYMTSVGVP